MLTLIGAVFAVTSVIAAFLVFREVQTKHLHIWMGTYLRSQLRQASRSGKSSVTSPVHILFCVVDHFEPIAEGSTSKQEQERMRDWLTRYPALARRHKDSDGRPPQHTWFYPGENYRAEYLDDLAKLCQQGLGEIELHLHHGYDTSASLRDKIQVAISNFSKHGALITKEVPPKHLYGFIHGNMALDNSMNNPALCGVNNEISVLRGTGCYADFSMPTAPAISQTQKTNAIYYVADDPWHPKSHNWGVDVETKRQPTGDLMIIQGPLALNWHSRKWGIIPRIENSEIQGSNPATPNRVHSWVRQGIHVKGRPEWIIVKVSCHGAEESSRDVLLGDLADQMYDFLEKEYRDQPGSFLHYVTARELYNIIKAAEAGLNGNPALYRDYFIHPYQTHLPVRAS